MGILNVEMEASALYIVARLRGLRAGMVCACSSNLVDGASLYSGTKADLQAGWMRSIEAALEPAVELELCRRPRSLALYGRSMTLPTRPGSKFRRDASAICSSAAGVPARRGPGSAPTRRNWRDGWW